MFDTIEKIGNSIVHHGKNNNRIYLMSLDPLDLFITNRLAELAKENGYTKVIAKIPKSSLSLFEADHYKVEACIPNLYHGTEDGYFLAKYYDEHRETDLLKEQNDLNIHQLCAGKARDKRDCKEYLLGDNYSYRIAKEDDVDEMAQLYRNVFPSYPFPIHDKEYILETMKENVIYNGIWDKNYLVALSSMEISTYASNVEMTDFATRKEYRGKGFANFLLTKMECIMRKQGIKTAYTIARSRSYGMNKVFSHRGYNYAGTLTNNTDIHGEIESMNVWYQPLIYEKK